MSLDKARERYRNDAIFRHLVDAMMEGFHRLNFSPGELREAAVFAEILYAERVQPHRDLFHAVKNGPGHEIE